MTSREDLREKVWQAWHASDEPWAGCADRERIERVLDAVLPQITTAEQLEALLVRVADSATPAAVVDRRNRIWTLFEDDRGDWYAQRLGDQDEPRAVTIKLDLGYWPAFGTVGPLTVVWQPAQPEADR